MKTQKVILLLCAWVLWIHHEEDRIHQGKPPERSSTWELIHASPTLDECNTIKFRIWRVYANRCRDQGRCQSVAGELFMETLESHDNFAAGVSDTFLCLPDTVDPRGRN